MAQLKAPPLRLAPGAVEAAAEHVLCSFHGFECCISNGRTSQGVSKLFWAN